MCLSEVPNAHSSLGAMLSTSQHQTRRRQNRELGRGGGHACVCTRVHLRVYALQQAAGERVCTGVCRCVGEGVFLYFRSPLICQEDASYM